MGLSQSDRIALERRINQKYEREIDRICIELEPGFHARISKEILAQTLNEMGIKSEKQRIQEIETTIQDLENQKAKLTEMQNSLRAEKDKVQSDICQILEMVGEESKYNRQIFIERETEKRKAIIARQLMLTDPIGKRIFQLEAERDTFLDLISIATTSKQYQEIWERYRELLSRSSLSEKESADDSTMK